MFAGNAGPSGEKMTTAAAKRKQEAEEVFEKPAQEEEPANKKQRKVYRGQQLSRDLLLKEDKVNPETIDMKVVCPMPRASDKKTVLMRKFVQEKCIMSNEIGVHSIKWSPEIELSNRDGKYDKKMLQANFKLYMTSERECGGDDDDAAAVGDEYSVGEYPVKMTCSLRKGLERKNNDTILEIDHSTFSLLVSQGRKLCNFVDKNLRGKTFNTEEEMKLPEIISLSSKETSSGGKVHILLMISIFKWGKRVGNKFQPFFNIRRFIENAEGKLIPTVKGLTLNFREMHNLVFSAAEYLNVMADQFAKAKLVHNKMKIVLGAKIHAFMKNNPNVNTEKLEFLLDSDNQAADSSDDDDDEEDTSDMQIVSDLKEISDSDNDNEMTETSGSFDNVSDADFI
jgi:hypothetical protein